MTDAKRDGKTTIKNIRNNFLFDVKLFLNETRKFLIQKDIYLEEEFNHAELKISETISCQNIKAKHIVFADGY